MNKIINVKNSRYWDIENTYKLNCPYTCVIGMRSNGKTFGCLKKGLERYSEGLGQMAIVRSWAEDFKGNRAKGVFKDIVKKGIVSDIFNGEYNTIEYKAGAWYLGSIDADSKITLAPEPFAWAFALTGMTHDKSVSYPDITFIVYDEFISRTSWIPDAFDLFQDVISTIVRERGGTDDIRIYMLANTVSYFSDFYDEMRINPRELKSGQIKVYDEYPNPKLKVALEYCDVVDRTDEETKFFDFGNKKSKMILKGEFEIPEYPRYREEIKPKDIKKMFFIKFKEYILQCEIIKTKYGYIINTHMKTTPVKYDNDIVYDLNSYDINPYRIRNILTDKSIFTMKILKLIEADRIYYADNVTGEVFRAYIQECLQDKQL